MKYKRPYHVFITVKDEFGSTAYSADFEIEDFQSELISLEDELSMYDNDSDQIYGPLGPMDEPANFDYFDDREIPFSRLNEEVEDTEDDVTVPQQPQQKTITIKEPVTIKYHSEYKSKAHKVKAL